MALGQKCGQLAYCDDKDIEVVSVHTVEVCGSLLLTLNPSSKDGNALVIPAENDEWKRKRCQKANGRQSRCGSSARVRFTPEEGVRVGKMGSAPCCVEWRLGQSNFFLQALV